MHRAFATQQMSLPSRSRRPGNSTCDLASATGCAQRREGAQRTETYPVTGSSAREVDVVAQMQVLGHMPDGSGHGDIQHGHPERI
jgi:hypothetical protein